MSASKNILSSDVEITGQLKFGQDLIIDGKIDGEIHSSGNLVVGESAQVKGEVKTGSITVFGKVEGNVTTDTRCELKASSSVVGDIQAGTLAMEEGAAFSGRSSIGGKKPGGGAPPAAAPAPGAPGKK